MKTETELENLKLEIETLRKERLQHRNNLVLIGEAILSQQVSSGEVKAPLNFKSWIVPILKALKNANEAYKL